MTTGSLADSAAVSPLFASPAAATAKPDRGICIESTGGMRTRSSAKLASVLAAAALSAGSALLAAHGGQDAPAPAAQQSSAPPGYVWAGACKDCHTAIYTSWENTKHARAINRLNKEDQAKDCIGCHSTGAKALIEDNGKPVNAGVQCEACHGPGAAHAADPTKRQGKVRESACTACHSDKSPHFKGFMFKGMAELSHPVKKT
jgi:hypothetical protein